MFSRPTMGVATVVALVALAACKAKDASQGRTSDTSAAPTTTASANAGPNVVTITATEYAFDAPAQVPAGLTTIRLVSQGKELHHASLIKLENGKTFQDFAAALKAMKGPGPEPSWAVDYGGPNPPVPGGTAEVTEMLEPGNYVIACFVPSPDGTPHIAKGMMRPLTVAPSSLTASAEPVADVVVTMNDYSFTLSTPLTPGHHVIRVENAGKQSHEMFLARLAPGKTTADLASWVEKMAGPPPAEPLGGVSAMHVGQHAYFTVDVQPGNYGLFCFIPDAKDSKPHVAHGMMKELTVS